MNDESAAYRLLRPLLYWRGAADPPRVPGQCLITDEAGEERLREKPESWYEVVVVVY